MSEIIDVGIERDAKSGRFLSGCKPGPGRSLGSRNRLAENFLASFAADFDLHGASVIDRVRAEQPAIYLKIAADLLPRDLRVELANEAEPTDGEMLNTIIEAFYDDTTLDAATIANATLRLMPLTAALAHLDRRREA